MTATIGQADVQQVEVLLERRILDRAAAWLPHLGGTPTVRLRGLGDRPRSALYRAELTTAHGRATVLAKVRKEMPRTAMDDGARPRLAADRLPAHRLTRLEYDGLGAIHAELGNRGSPFGTVRPLDHMTAPSVIFMEWVPGVPLRSILTERSRLVPSGLHGRAGSGSWHAWSDVGAWLRAFQAALPAAGLPPRTATAREVVELFGAFGEFLSRRLGSTEPRSLAEAGAALASAVLPECLPVTAGHGDYAPRNVLVDPGGRLTVVDPLPRWAVPRHEDLCRFLVGVRLLGLQVHTRGLAYPRHWIAYVEDEVIRGYFQEEPVPAGQLRCLQLLLLLDKWSALVEGSGGGWRGRVRTRSAAGAGRFLGSQGRELLELGASARH